MPATEYRKGDSGKANLLPSRVIGSCTGSAGASPSRFQIKLILLCLIVVTRAAGVCRADDVEDHQLHQEFSARIWPFLRLNCLGCHGPEKQEGKLDLSGATSVDVIVASHGVWEIVLQRLEGGEMPPAEATQQPTHEERQSAIRWLRDLRAREASRNAGDPGIVLARRLSNAEFDYSIRDLTGVDIRPTKEFPVDPANEAGFDNSGESLTMTPALLKKYLLATKSVADHLVLKPGGFAFAPHPVISETDRDKFCVQRIVSFYDRHKVNYADYFLSAWRFQHRADAGRPNAELSEFAAESGLSPQYLAMLWATLHTVEVRGPVKELQAEWATLPADVAQFEDARTVCERLSKLVAEIRSDLEIPFEQIEIEGNSRGSQPLILWWNRQIAAGRMTFRGQGEDADLNAARDRFCRIFPSAFSVSSRGHYSDGDLGASVRLLSAGFHLMQGYFRDDQPLYDLVLTDEERRELDEMWQDLNFVTLAPMRQYKDFLFFERAEPPRFAGGPEFDFARPEDKDSTSEEKLTRMRDVYVSKVKDSGAGEQALDAVQTYFADMARDLRWIERTRIAAEPGHLEDLLQFAERAWRRPMSPVEREEVMSFYHRLRDVEGLSHDDAIRDSVASVLMSPYFSYRVESAGSTADASETSLAIRPLTEHELANRLSYFLWSSMPDEELLSHAASGDLHEPVVLAAQARRMLQDPKVRGLATEFLGNWLEFRRFEEHNSVDRDRFPSFTSDLRSAMFEEPVQFFTDLAQRDGSMLELLAADHTFVNRTLADHYGAEVSALAEPTDPDAWVRLDNAGTIGRGGLLPMSVFLTKNSPGLRTSPVKRGYWVVRRLLGEHIPAPPPNVPELPKDESQSGALTLAEHLAMHRNHAACAGCHQHFDSIGLVFESFGPIGERRSLDLGGHPVQTQATFPDGTSGSGLEDLRRYLLNHRRDDLIDNVVRRMFVFALGRGVLLSDTQAIESATLRLAENDYRLGTLVETIITSPQFVHKRVHK